LRAPAAVDAVSHAVDPASISRYPRASRYRPRRMGYCGKGRSCPQARMGIGPAKLQGVSDSGTVVARTRPTLLATFLGKASRSRTSRSFRPLWVGTGVGGGGGGSGKQPPMAPRLRRDQRIRTDDGRRWHSDSEVLSAYYPGGADPPVQGTHHQSAQTL